MQRVPATVVLDLGHVGLAAAGWADFGNLGLGRPRQHDVDARGRFVDYLALALRIFASLE